MIPSEPVMLLSYVNMKLRDSYRTLDELCDDLAIDKLFIKEKLKTIDYFYDESTNRFC